VYLLPAQGHGVGRSRVTSFLRPERRLARDPSHGREKCRLHARRELRAQRPDRRDLRSQLGGKKDTEGIINKP
jgi:hypothetical protein